MLRGEQWNDAVCVPQNPFVASYGTCVLRDVKCQKCVVEDLALRSCPLMLSHAIDAALRLHWVWAVHFFNELQVVRGHRIPYLFQVSNKIGTSVRRKYLTSIRQRIISRNVLQERPAF